MLSAIVLGFIIMSVIAFAYAYHQARHAYLARLSSMLARTEEAISVSGWTRGLHLLLEISNEGGTGVLAREVKTLVQLSMEVPYGVVRLTRARTAVLTERNVYLRPGERRYFWYNLSYYVPATATNATISFASVTVVTERNAFIYDIRPPVDRAAVAITRDYIVAGKSLAVQLPNGRTVVFKPYEIMFCSVSTKTRTSTPVPEYDSTLIIVQGKNRYVGAYHYGYDPVNRVWNRVQMTITRYNESNADVCELVAPRYGNTVKTFPPGETQIVFARGLLLVGTHLHNYDIDSVLFADLLASASSPPPTAALRATLAPPENTVATQI